MNGGNTQNQQFSDSLTQQQAIDGRAMLSETTIEMGGQMIEAMGNDLTAAASGHLKDVDMDNARLRLRDVQMALVSLGYSLNDDEDDVGHIESGDSRALSETIRVFQDENDLDVTGRIDRETYETIMGNFEEALGVVDHRDTEDDFHFLHTGETMGDGEGLTEQSIEQAEAQNAEMAGLDGDDEALLNLEMQADDQVDSQELEDL